MKAELVELAKGSYEVEFLEDFDAKGDGGKAEELLKSAMAMEKVGIVYAAGVMATERAQAMANDERKKPIVAGALQLTDSRGQPISKTGTSILKNYTFITSPQRLAADVDLTKQLTKATTIHVAIDQSFITEIKELDQATAAMEKKFGVKISFIGVGSTATGALGKFPSDTKAAYITILPRMPNAERKKLYNGLAKRGIPTVSMNGEEDVQLGAMAGLAPNNTKAVARRSALNIHQLFLGSDSGSLPVYLPVQDHLIINSTTAKATGWSPDYDTALEAEFINEPTAGYKQITLEEAMGIANTHNLDVLIAREDEIIATQDTAIGRSALLPQVNLNGSSGRNGVSDKIDPMSPDYTSQGKYGLEIRQILFNDEVSSGLKALRQSEAAKHYDTISMRYDVVEAAALAYFDLLSARTLAEIEKENLRLTQNNLQLARLRVDIGAAQPSEVYRWEQDRASGKASLIQRDADVSNAEIELNRILRRPLDTKWLPEDIQVADDEIFFMDAYTKDNIETRNEFLRFGSFLQFLAVENSPELYSFDHLLASQGILLGQKQRRFYLPEISASAGIDRVVNGSSGADRAGQNESSIGIQFSFPLGEGGKRKAEVLQQQATIRQLAIQRERAVQQIEQRALVAMNGIGAAHPNIRLSRTGYEFAQKNYESTQEKYAQGAASILDLLDAQTALLQQKQQFAVAGYSYLKQIFGVQRAVGWFEYQKNANEKKLWVELFKTFMKDGKITTRNGTYPRPPAKLAPVPENIPRKPAALPVRGDDPKATAPPEAKPKKKRKRFPLFKKR